MLPSVPTSNRDDDGLLVAHLRHSLLILRPKPRHDRFFDVLQRFFLVRALRDAAGKRRALRDDVAVRLFELHVENHGRSYTPLPQTLPGAHAAARPRSA